jgi:hypothetical protein
MLIRCRWIALVLVAGAIAAAASCSESTPVGVSLPALTAAKSGTQTAPKTKPTGLVACAQSYDSATKVFGPAGDTMQVGPHILAIHANALTDTVRITAVAPAANVRWVRFQPDGLVFLPTVDGWSALVVTNYKDCGVPTMDTLRIAQVNDSLAILGYLQTFVQSRKNPWSQANQFVVGLLQHFSNYAVAW